jgi:hypothetical protein
MPDLEVVMPSPFGHYGHVARVAGLFAAALFVFLLVRAFLVPADFGRYGFYRAGALDDIRARPADFGGEASCKPCHAKTFDERKDTRHAKVHCEACHGPLQAHVIDPKIKPASIDLKQPCIQCHTKLAGRPSFVPQVVVADHSGDAECGVCHQPHSPKIQSQ